MNYLDVYLFPSELASVSWNRLPAYFDNWQDASSTDYLTINDCDWQDATYKIFVEKSPVEQAFSLF